MFQIAQKLQDKAEAMLQFPLAQIQQDAKTGNMIVKPTKWSFGHAATLARLGFELTDLAIKPPGDGAGDNELCDETFNVVHYKPPE